MLKYTGFDDNIVLARALALPVINGPPYSSQSHDVRTGVGSTILREFVYYNIGAGARSDRQINGLTLAADGILGNTITGRARYINLLELLQSLAIQAGNLGFRVIQSGSNIQFQVYASTDKTSTAVFSPDMENLVEYSYLEEASRVNYVWVGGGNEGTARIIVERGNSSSIQRYGRAEDFKDRRDTTDTDELYKAADEVLEKEQQITRLGILPIDTQGLMFRRDWDLGDKVTVIVDDEEIKDIVREVTLELSREESERIKPTIGGKETAANVGWLIDRLKGVESRVANLERV
jgi:hypothetical protein